MRAAREISVSARRTVPVVETAAGMTVDQRRATPKGLKRARELEALGFLQITLAAAEKVPWTGGFAVVP